MGDEAIRRGMAWNGRSTRLVVVLAVLANLLILASALVAFSGTRTYYHRQAEVWTQNIAKLLEVSVIDKFDDVDAVLSLLVHECGSGGHGDRNRLSSVMAFQKSRLASITTLLIADRDGLVTCGDGVTPSINVSDRDYFRALRDDPRTVVSASPLLRGRVSGSWEVFLARRISNPDGSFAGAAVAGVDIRYFDQLFSRLEVGPRGAIGIRDREFHLVALHPKGNEPGSRIGSSVVSDTTKEIIRANPVTATYRTVFARDHQERVVTFRSIRKYPLYVFATISPDDFLSAWRKELVLALVLLAVLMSATTAITVAIIRNRSIEVEKLAAVRYGEDLCRQNTELSTALARIKKLEGIIPICAYCKKIRVEEESWDQLEKYITEHSDARFSHGICPDCAKHHFP